MTSGDLRAWQVFLNLGDRAAAKTLGTEAAEYAALLASTAPIDHRIALACAALAAGLGPRRSHVGSDESPPPKPRPRPQHLLPVHD